MVSLQCFIHSFQFPFQVIGKLQRGRLGQVRIKFSNPLEVPLTLGHVSVECAGMMRPIKERVTEIAPNADFEHLVLVSPRKAGKGTIVANFGSEEMIDVYGSCTVEVME